MKLILREYLASLREREELDAILPDLLSELGFTVYSRPQRGTTQYGVDVAAVSPESGQKRKVYLFSIKKGDLTRTEWHAVPQGMRSSLTEILDVYIPTRLPSEYAELKIVICICVGGEIQEQIRSHLAGFTNSHTSERISFEEWTGDRIANLLLEGVLRQEVLPPMLQSHFQKAVALLDEPDVAYRHFSQLLRQLHNSAAADDKERVRAARQIYICLWVLYVWGREIGNIEAPYLGSELAILTTWELLKPLIGVESQHHRALVRVLDQIIKVHIRIADEYIAKRIAPAAKVRDALGMAVGSRTAVDVNIKIFDLVGRIGMTGLWVQWLAGEQREMDDVALRAVSQSFYDVGITAIENNSGFGLPVSDVQTTDIALFAVFCLRGAPDGTRLMSWLKNVVERYDLAVRVRGKYPVAYTEYSDLVAHPRDGSEEYFKESTAGSTLIPFLAIWAQGLGRSDLATRLVKLTGEELPHCTVQLWTPGEDSEEHLYVNSSIHGRAICDLPMVDGGVDLLETISEACTSEHGCQSLSAFRTGFWPIILLACRHWRLPVPPDFYINSLLSMVAETAARVESSEPPAVSA